MTEPDCGRLNAITRLISVLLPDPLEPTSAVVEPAGAMERHVLQDRHAGVVLERDVVELDLTTDVGDRTPALRPLRSSVAIRRISRMRSRPAKASVTCVPMDASWITGNAISPVNIRYMTKSPMVMLPRSDRRAAHEDHHDADGAEHERREGGDGGDAGQRLRDVAEQPMGAAREHQLLALLGGVGLDDADAAEAFGEASGHFGVDLAALAEERPQSLEGHRHAAAEGAEHDDGDGRSAASSR